MRLIDVDKLKIEHMRRGNEIFIPHVSLNQLLLVEEVEAIPIAWLEMFMQRYKIEGGNEYKLLHFMVTEWKKWEKENEDSNLG